MAVVIKGKDGNERHYETVAERVRKFREKFPLDSGWRILPEISFPNPETVLCRASIINPEGTVVAIGTAEETRNAGYINRTSAVENCETSAIGRALFSAGFGGGEFCSADELHAALTKGRDMERVKHNKPVNGGNNAPPPTQEQHQPPSLNQQVRDIAKADGFEFLKKFGMGLRVDNGQLIVTEMTKGAIYKHRGILKSSGFRFDSGVKSWVRSLHQKQRKGEIS